MHIFSAANFSVAFVAIDPVHSNRRWWAQFYLVRVFSFLRCCCCCWWALLLPLGLFARLIPPAVIRAIVCKSRLGCLLSSHLDALNSLFKSITQTWLPNLSTVTEKENRKTVYSPRLMALVYSESLILCSFFIAQWAVVNRLFIMDILSCRDEMIITFHMDDKLNLSMFASLNGAHTKNRREKIIYKQ